MATAATEIATEAFGLADSSKLIESAALYRRAIGLADAQSDDLERMHSEFATVLSRLGDLHAALDQRRLALKAALNEGGEPDSLTVFCARYFLGDLLLEMGKPDEALEIVQPSL